ncbi:MAG: hypothetical protein KDC65_08325, partial [Saprospiraceae bacterium]|nr:hypothetical protein [Saprospiraceae bacterium]
MTGIFNGSVEILHFFSVIVASPLPLRLLKSIIQKAIIWLRPLNGRSMIGFRKSIAGFAKFYYLSQSCWSTVNRQPSTVNRQPSTVNRQPSTVN